MGSLYSDRVYGEHPIGLWSFSEGINYLTLLDPADEDVTTWAGSSVAKYIAFVRDRIPSFPGIGDSYQVSGTATSNYLEVHKHGILDPTTFAHVGSFDVGFWGFYSGPFSYFEVVPIDADGNIPQIGVDELAAPTYYVPSIILANPDAWTPIIATFAEPQPGYESVFGVRIRAYYPDTLAHTFLIGGIASGQLMGSKMLSENGMQQFKPPVSSGLQYFDISSVVGINEYGFGMDTAYAVVDTNKLLANSRGIPMVYGDSSSVHLTPSTLPSIVFPGKGCFNESGRNRELTLELWLRIKNSSHIETRILGPLGSSDGLWISDNALVLVVGEHIASYDTRDLFAPKLVQIVFVQSGVALVVDGTEVAKVPYNGGFPNNYNHNADWIGLFMDPDLDLFEIGPVAVYPYQVSSLMTKRRYVWGQGVRNIGTGDLASFQMSTAVYNNTANIPITQVFDPSIVGEGID